MRMLIGEQVKVENRGNVSPVQRRYWKRYTARKMRRLVQINIEDAPRIFKYSGWAD